MNVIKKLLLLILVALFFSRCSDEKKYDHHTNAPEENKPEPKITGIADTFITDQYTFIVNPQPDTGYWRGELNPNESAHEKKEIALDASVRREADTLIFTLGNGRELSFENVYTSVYLHPTSGNRVEEKSTGDTYTYMRKVPNSPYWELAHYDFERRTNRILVHEASGDQIYLSGSIAFSPSGKFAISVRNSLGSYAFDTKDVYPPEIEKFDNGFAFYEVSSGDITQVGRVIIYDWAIGSLSWESDSVLLIEQEYPYALHRDDSPAKIEIKRE